MILGYELWRIRVIPQAPLDVQKLLAPNVILEMLLEQSRIPFHQLDRGCPAPFGDGHAPYRPGRFKAIDPAFHAKRRGGREKAYLPGVQAG
jgi:hypothetical protein